MRLKNGSGQQQRFSHHTRVCDGEAGDQFAGKVLYIQSLTLLFWFSGARYQDTAKAEELSSMWGCYLQSFIYQSILTQDHEL